MVEVGKFLVVRASKAQRRSDFFLQVMGRP